MRNDSYDVIIIGTGAGGGTMAHRLAQTGKRILVLERGGFLPREKENWDQREVFTKGRYLAKETWLDRAGQTFQPYTHYWVGGNTKVYGAALLRLRESDFREVRHYGGISPAWPLSYADFEPWYARAENLYQVHGQAEGDPNGPPRSSPYPYPALPYEPHMQTIADGFRRLGLRPFPCALGVRMGEDEPQPSARRVLSNFDGYPDPTGTKADAEVSCIKPALGVGNVTLLTDRKVERLETDADGRVVTAVIVRHGEALERYSGDIVIVACGAINSAALLLRSANDRHPAGLANRSGLVGRNYMCHNNGIVIAISRDINPSQFQKAFAITDFYHGADDSEYPLGSIQLMGKPDADFLESLTRDLLPDIKPEMLWTHTVDFFLTAEDLPDPDNRVTLAEGGRIQLTYRENNREAYDRLRAKLITYFDGIGSQGHGSAAHAYVGPKLGIKVLRDREHGVQVGLTLPVRTVIAEPGSIRTDPP